MKAKDIQAHTFLTQHHAEISNAWLKEVEENPRYKEALFNKDGDFANHSKVFLDELSTTFDQAQVPNLNAQALEPVIKLWQDIRKNHRQQGLSAKDTALLIFSFKSTLVKALQNQYKSDGFEFNEDVEKLSNLLDFLGILTYELYSDEQAATLPGSDKTALALPELKQDHFVGSSRAMGPVFKAIQLVLDNDITILLEGESGTGKDVLANLIHKNSTRKNKPLITLNCGAIPKDLIESELFGHEKGAFTGATETRPGKFEQADGSTLFLDEIGELPLDLQVKLLRVLQNREVERIGGRKRIPIDVRIIAATNRNLKQAVEAKQFRLDLYYRLNVFPISIPPLRERRDDIVPLAQFFLDKYAKEYGHDAATLSQDAEVYLLKQPWEGNIRELENLMQRMTIIAGGGTISATLLAYLPGQSTTPLLAEHKNVAPELSSPTIAEPSSPTPIGGHHTPETPAHHTNTSFWKDDEIPSLDEVEAHAMKHALDVTDGNIKHAADALGISRTTFYTKAEKYGIEIKSWLLLGISIFTLLTTGTPAIAAKNTPHRYPKEYNELRGYSVVFRYVYRSANKAIVGIQTQDSSNDSRSEIYYSELPATDRPLAAKRHLGSGVIISNTGLIITSYQNIREREQIEVVLHNGNTLQATRIGMDPPSNIALLKVPGTRYPFLTPAPQTEQTRMGDWVVALGHSPEFGISIATGILASPPQPTRPSAPLATNALVPASHSGGALVDLHGRLVGVTSLMAAPAHAQSSFGMAIPATYALRVAKSLERYGVVKRGWIGASSKPVPAKTRRQHKLNRNHGVIITAISPNSPAQNAKLRKGDIVLAVGNTRITSTTHFTTTIEDLPIGKPAKLHILRGRSTKQTLSINPADSPNTTPLPDGAQITDALGLIVTEPDVNMLPDDTEYAVLVTSVEPDSPAARVGVKVGDYIVSINENDVLSLQEYDALLESLPGSAPAQLSIVRNNTTITIKILL